MKALFMLFTLLAVLGSSVLGQAPAKKNAARDTVKTQHVKAVYTCTMHPEVTSSKPGKCPKCGMDLVKRQVKKPAAKKQAAAEGVAASPAITDTYACPMHADVTSNKPGTCPKCKMDLVKKKS